MCSDKISANIVKVKSLAKVIEKVDREIGQIGFTHPELKPITDMFNKRKENFQGNDPAQLASDTRKCYQNLLNESEGMHRRLTLTLEALRYNRQAAVSSFKVEVPGK